MCVFRQATQRDIPSIWQIILQAKSQMYRQGKHQWSENYPQIINIENDINKGFAYVLEKEKEVIAYGAVVFSGEEAYKELIGQWLTNTSYVVVHRLAVSDKMKQKGIATMFMQQVMEISKGKNVFSFKIDTNYDNFYMLKMFKKLGFTYCGKVHYESGERMAYEKVLK